MGVLMLLDAWIVGWLTSLFVQGLLGDSPSARLLKLVFGIASGAGYILLLGIASKGSDFVLITVLFGPMAIVAFLLLLNYMYK